MYPVHDDAVPTKIIGYSTKEEDGEIDVEGEVYGDDTDGYYILTEGASTTYHDKKVTVASENGWNVK